MIYTSYFGNWRNYPEGYKKICIARWSPPGFKPNGKTSVLAPSADLLKRIKAGLIGEAQYAVEFNEQLSKLDPVVVATKCEGCILLCYERPEDFCHRHLVRKWLNDNSVECEELSNQTQALSNR